MKIDRRFIWINGVLAVALPLAGISLALASRQKDISERSIEFSEKINFVIPEASSNVRIWIPIPKNDPYQNVKLLSLKAPTSHQITQDSVFGNSFIYIESPSSIKNNILEIKSIYKIVRKEQRGGETAEGISDSALSDYLLPRGLEVINENIRKISEETIRGKSRPMDKAREIYQYVLKHMSYDKSGEGWGRGDSLYACDIGKGNCTDFHSLFIVLARASRIPARFQMGIPLPNSREGEPSGNYHCWAEFYIEEKGWIPVDISEAWKNPDKAEYFFGNLDENRILLSTGREILLSPEQAEAPLNYLSKPYIEIDGKPLNDFQLERRFKNSDQLSAVSRQQTAVKGGSKKP